MPFIKIATRLKQRIMPLASILAFALVAGATPAGADAAGKRGPGVKAPVILEVTVQGKRDVKAFSFEQLEKLGVASVKTSTPWTKASATFEGVYLKDVLSAAGAKTGQVKAVALNDYASSLPASDAYAHNVLLAYKMNGKRLSVRDKGPLWIVYPFDMDPSLKREVIYSRSVWQLKRLEVTP